MIRGSKAVERKRTSLKERWKLIKYLALLFILSAALLRVSLAAYGAPIPIITRFYALLVYPVFTLMADAGFTIVRPIADKAGIASLAYADLLNPVFALQWFIIVLPGVIFASAFWAPRFWCRYLCPSGAISRSFPCGPFSSGDV